MKLEGRAKCTNRTLLKNAGQVYHLRRTVTGNVLQEKEEAKRNCIHFAYIRAGQRGVGGVRRSVRNSRTFIFIFLMRRKKKKKKSTKRKVIGNASKVQRWTAFIVYRLLLLKLRNLVY